MRWRKTLNAAAPTHPGLLLLVVLVFWRTGVVNTFVLEGSQTSYAQFRKWYSAQNASIEFEFLTDQPNGILLYTDDGGYYDFIELKLVEGSVRLRYNFGQGARVMNVGKNLNDGKTWHHVLISRNKSDTLMVLDHQVRVSSDNHSVYFGPSKSTSLYNNHLEFGNFTTNSYVYVGGLPSWYNTKLSMLALPSVVFEPRFKGSVRNILYADDESGKPRRQEVMAYKGVRASTVDACSHHNPCQNGGICVSTDGGPICECQYIDFGGAYCDKNRTAAEATFDGHGFLMYNLFEKSGEPILSLSDEISLHFRTNRKDGLLFYTGDGSDYMSIGLADHAIVLSISIGDGRLEAKVKPPTIQFHDDKWHHIVVTRLAQKHSLSIAVCHVTMIVDGSYMEKWMTTGAFSMLSSSKVFIAGSQDPYKLPKTQSNFVGCLKKVEMKADSLHLPLLALAKEGHHLLTMVGSVSFQCKTVQPLQPVSFTTSASYMVVDTWNSTHGGSFSFLFRTNEPHGLLFFSKGAVPAHQSDFFAIELVDGFLYLHLHLGSGAIRQRTSNKRLDDAFWHKVEIVRSGKATSVKLDEEQYRFETPGDATTLDLASPLYVGGLDAIRHQLAVPPVVWSASLRQGFVGCMNDLIINGKTINLSEFAHKQDSSSVLDGCHVSPAKCDVEQPCMNGGQCSNGWNRYSCDCRNTSYTGPTCAKAAPTIQFDGSQHVTFDKPALGVSEAELLSFRFKTAQKDGILVVLRDSGSIDRLEFILDNGKLRFSLVMGSVEKKFHLGDQLGDDRWHSVKYERRGKFLSLGIDRQRPIISEIFGNDVFLDYTRLHVGAVVPRDGLVPAVKNFQGFMQQLVFNGEHYFDQMRSGSRTEFVMTATFYPKKTEEVVVPYQTLSIRNQKSYIGLAKLKAYADISINFDFKTLVSDGLILYNAGKAYDFVAVELVNGHIHYVVNLGYGIISIKDNAPRSLNDNQWHSVLIGRPTLDRHTLMVDNHLAVAKSIGNDPFLDLEGILFLGGVKTSMYGKLPNEVLSSAGFEGCLGSLELAGEAAYPLQNALVSSESVIKGCDESVTYEWGPRPGLIKYHFEPNKRPDTQMDTLSLGLITPLHDAVLFRVVSATTNDYLEMEIVDGHIYVAYNPGSSDNAIGETNVKVNDGRYHVVRFTRSGPNSTLQIDDYHIHRKYPDGRQMAIFNTQAQIQIGGRWNPTLKRVERPFEGILSGVVYNGLRPLDMTAYSDPKTKVQGDVRVLDNIPFDYREKNKARFESSYSKVRKDDMLGMQRSESSFLPEPGINDDLIYARVKCDQDQDKYYDSRCFTYDGSGDELITPMYTPPPRPATTSAPIVVEKPVSTPPSIILSGGGTDCDDEDDCLYNSSGEEGGGQGDPNVATKRPPDPFYVDSHSVVTELPIWQDKDEEEDGSKINEVTLRPFPSLPSDTHQPQVVYENYDTKYNVYDKEPKPKDPTHSSKGSLGDGFRITETATSGTILVIGIIAGALIAIILIVIIVFKMRTRSENQFKVEEPRMYHYAANSGEDTGFEAPVPLLSNATVSATAIGGVATTPATKVTIKPADNGFYARHVQGKKANGARGIREWYV